MRNIGAFNKALFMKKSRRIRQNPHLLLSRVYHNTTTASNRLSRGRKGTIMADKLLQN